MTRTAIILFLSGSLSSYSNADNCFPNSMGTTYSVFSNANSDHGTLRQAILDGNSDQGCGHIYFNVTQPIAAAQSLNPIRQNRIDNSGSTLSQFTDSTFNWKWDSLAGGWEINPVFKTLSYTDSLSHEGESITYAWNGLSWDNHIQQIDSFDSNFNLTGRWINTGSGSSWVDSLRLSNQF